MKFQIKNPIVSDGIKNHVKFVPIESAISTLLLQVAVWSSGLSLAHSLWINIILNTMHFLSSIILKIYFAKRQGVENIGLREKYL